MPVYSELLKRALASSHSGAARQEIYSRARSALVQRLREAHTLPREITRERLLLEESIRQIEAEAAERLREDARR